MPRACPGLSRYMPTPGAGSIGNTQRRLFCTPISGPGECPQRILTGRLQGREFAFNKEPNTGLVDSIVTVPEPIADTANLPPRNVRTELFGSFAELHGRLADDHQSIFDGEYDLFVVCEAPRVQAIS